MTDRLNKIPADISYGLLKGVLYLIALMPLGVLYVFSSALAWMTRVVFRYRLKVVRANLDACFPELTLSERRAIERSFYRNFADYIVETVKLLHISDKQMSRRMTFTGLDRVDAMLADGHNVIAYFAHTFNWEWAPSICLHSSVRYDLKVRYCQIYRPLRNAVFDRLMLHIRSRFGSVSLAKSNALRDFLTMRREGVTSITGFMSDQKPSHGDHTHVLDFFGRPTAVITGTEALARRLATAVVYWDMVRLGRGRYRIDIRVLTEDASTVDPWHLSAAYFAELQSTIKRDPSNWLWTHKRWKNSPASWAYVDPKTLIRP